MYNFVYMCIHIYLLIQCVYLCINQKIYIYIYYYVYRSMPQPLELNPRQSRLRVEPGFRVYGLTG